MSFMKLQPHASKSCFLVEVVRKESCPKTNEIPLICFLTLKICYFFLRRKKQIKTSWWFQTFFYFHPEPWGRWTHSCLIFFRWVGSTTNQIKMFPIPGVSDLGIRCLFVGSDSVLGSFVVGIALPRPSTSFHDYGRAEEVEKSQIVSLVRISKFPGSGPDKNKYEQSHISLLDAFDKDTCFFCFCWAVHFVVVTLEYYIIYVVLVFEWCSDVVWVLEGLAVKL